MDEATEGKRAPKRRASLQGTNLTVDVRTGIYVWRRLDEKTGRRFRRSTGAKSLEVALKKARDYEDEYQRKLAGLADYSSWRIDLSPLADQWVASQTEVTEGTRKAKELRIRRALEKLGLKTAADLDNVGVINDRLLALESQGVRRRMLRYSYQEPLRQFSAWLCENKRYLECDPLATWKPIRVAKTGKRVKRAFLPEEVARTFLALHRLDEIQGRKQPQAVVAMALLITSARVSALASRNVSDFDEAGQRINFGANVGNKRRGAGALDPKTAKEIAAHLAAREEKNRNDPLFLSADGTRCNKDRLLDVWKEAFGLGVVDALWPKNEPRNLDLAYLVNLALKSGRVRVSKGGNPNLVREDTLEKRAEKETHVQRLADLIGPEWRERMAGVRVHALRMTHRSWGEACGVPGVVLDKQLGHTAQREGRDELVAAISGSRTGREYYLDLELPLFNAARAAEAVRSLLDQALARVIEAGTCLAAPSTPASGEPARPGEALAQANRERASGVVE
jgi:hypothetical protein